MLKVNIADAKAHLSSYLDRVAQGETIVLCRRNVPVAEIRPLAQRRTEERPVGTDPGRPRPVSRRVGDNSIELVDGWRGEPYFWGNRSLHETSGTRLTMCCCLPTTATRSTAAWFRRPCFTG